ncbi:MAG: flagellar FliL protein [Pseudohongiellaceae bacterium]|jgi:flagellar FliL protein
MAEDFEEKELNLDEGSAPATASPKKSKTKLIAIIIVALLAAAGVAAYFLLGTSADADSETLEAEVEVEFEEAHYLLLEPAFIINLPDRGKQRFLQASITLMARSSSSLLKIEQNMPVIRHNLTNILSAQTISSIQSSGGIDKVRSQALNQINTVLSTQFNSEAIEQVLFTAFVMQ